MASEVSTEAPPAGGAVGAYDETDLRVTFSDLVQARFLTSKELAKSRGSGMWEKEYRRRLSAFEREQGQIERSLWGTNAALGLAITIERQTRLRRWLGMTPRMRLLRSTESVAIPPDVEAALNDGDVLAAKAAQVLSGDSRFTILLRVFAAQSYLLRVIDTAVAGEQSIFPTPNSGEEAIFVDDLDDLQEEVGQAGDGLSLPLSDEQQEEAGSTDRPREV